MCYLRPSSTPFIDGPVALAAAAAPAQRPLAWQREAWLFLAVVLALLTLLHAHGPHVALAAAAAPALRLLAQQPEGWAHLRGEVT